MEIKRIIAAAAAIGLAVGLVGCSSDSGSKSSSTTTPKEAVCADKANLETSVRALTDSDTLSGGKTSIEAALKKVQKDLTALKASAKVDLKPKVDAVKAALDQLQTVMGDFTSGSITDNLAEAGDAISKVGTTTSALVTALNTECP